MKIILPPMKVKIKIKIQKKKPKKREKKIYTKRNDPPKNKEKETSKKITYL